MTAAPSVPVVASATEWSCGLACLESLARQRGLDVTQAGLLAALRDRFPLWKAKPGACAFHIRVLGREHWLVEWELLDLARHLGLARSAVLLGDRAALEAHLAGQDPAALALTRRSREDGALIELNHAVRVLAAGPVGVSVMNPGRRRGGRLERWTWPEFVGLEPIVFGLRP